MANYGGRGYARRLELIRAKGFTTEREYRNASKAERTAGAKRAAAAGAYRDERAAKQAVEQVEAPKHRLLKIGGGREIITSMRNRELYAFLKRADARELRVWGLVDRSIPAPIVPGAPVIEPAGGPAMIPFDQITLWRRGGIDPSYILGDLEAAGSRDVIAWLTAYLAAPDLGPESKNTRGRSPRMLTPPPATPGRRGKRGPTPVITMVQFSSGVASGAEGTAA